MTMTTSRPCLDSAAAAMRVLDDHMAALNARDAQALAATLHFPHHRIGRDGMKMWPTPDTYLDDFFARAGDGWARSEWDFRNVVAASPAKVHLDVAFTRYNTAGEKMGSFRSLWIVTERDGRWAALARSSFAV